MSGSTDTPRRIGTRTILGLLLVCALLAPLPAWGQATTFRDVFTAPYDVVLVNECTGEEVHLTGELVIRIRTTIDATGGIHAAFHLTPRHVRGVGVESGIAYHAVGGLRDSFNAAADFAPLVGTTTQMFNLVSQGGSDNLQVKFVFHLTVNAQGEVTAEIDNFSLACVG